jgi:hypothetical protein
MAVDQAQQRLAREHAELDVRERRAAGRTRPAIDHAHLAQQAAGADHRDHDLAVGDAGAAHGPELALQHQHHVVVVVRVTLFEQQRVGQHVQRLHDVDHDFRFGTAHAGQGSGLHHQVDGVFAQVVAAGRRGGLWHEEEGCGAQFGKGHTASPPMP